MGERIVWSRKAKLGELGTTSTRLVDAVRVGDGCAIPVEPPLLKIKKKKKNVHTHGTVRHV